MMSLKRIGRSGAGLALALGVAMGLAPVVGADVRAQEEEECNCDLPRVLTRSSGFSSLMSRPMLGVSLEMEVDRDMESVGAVITDVMEDGPAEEAGLQAGDIVTALDGQDLTEPLDGRAEDRLDDDESFPGQRLVALARELEEGEPVQVDVIRDGEALSFTVTPENLPGWQIAGNLIPDVTRRLQDFSGQLENMDLAFDVDGGRGSWVAPQVRVQGGDNFFALFRAVRGLELVDLNPGLGAYFGTEVGVLVADVDEASELGLEAGDVLLEIDGRQVDDARHVRRILSSYQDGEDVEFRIVRDGGQLSVSGQVE
ncbi:MAG: PDZ domain-containing protein [Longimicrobiales bacterium]